MMFYLNRRGNTVLTTPSDRRENQEKYSENSVVINKGNNFMSYQVKVT